MFLQGFAAETMFIPQHHEVGSKTLVDPDIGKIRAGGVIAKPMMGEFVRNKRLRGPICCITLVIGVEFLRLAPAAENSVIMSGYTRVFHRSDGIIERGDLVVFIPGVTKIESS